MNLDELKKQIASYVDAEDSTGLERFAIDHFKEFPEDVQGQILMAFLGESIEKQDAQEEIEKLRKEGIEALAQISALKAVLQMPADG